MLFFSQDNKHHKIMLTYHLFPELSLELQTQAATYLYESSKDIFIKDGLHSSEELRVRLHEAFASPNFFWVVFTPLQEMIGMVSCDYQHYSVVPCLGNLQVFPDFQRQGYGTQIIQRVLDEVHQTTTIPEVYLWCEPSLRLFYEKLHWVKHQSRYHTDNPMKRFYIMKYVLPRTEEDHK